MKISMVMNRSVDRGSWRGRSSACLTTTLILLGACSTSSSNGPTASDAGSTKSDGGSVTDSAQADSGKRGLPCGTKSGTGCAPESQRVDLYEPTFSNPTKVDNRFYPVSQIHSNVFIGIKDGKQFRSEGTLLPRTKKIAVNGKEIETLVWQYMSFFDGRLEEVAYDWFAQDDKGAVWYFGEDVADYNEDGVIYTHEGTWLVGRDGGLAMIMPAVPKVGDVFRAEDAAPAAFEEITIKTAGETREGPSGQVGEVMVGSELKMDGKTEQKVFAPGYGEFSTGTLATGGVEPIALSVPTDAVTSAPPSELAALATQTAQIFEAATSAQWTKASSAMTAVTTAANSLNTGTVPPLLKAELAARVGLLGAAISASDADEARQQAIAVAIVTFDLRLRHRPPTEIDRQRFDVWLAQVVFDASSGSAGDVRGDVSTLELMWDRIAHTFDAPAAADVKRLLADLRKAADASDATQAATSAGQLRTSFAATGWK